MDSGNNKKPQPFREGLGSNTTLVENCTVRCRGPSLEGIAYTILAGLLAHGIGSYDCLPIPGVPGTVAGVEKPFTVAGQLPCLTEFPFHPVI
jgi:hypothetical protein